LATAAVLIIAALVCGALASWEHSVASTDGGHRVAVRTPLWSPRRIPGPIVGAADQQRTTPSAQHLQTALDADVARYGNSCFVVTKGSHVLASHDADTPLIPASTQKLLTAAAGLEKLGSSFRYETKAVAVAPAGSTTLDRLWLVGSGDPVIATAEGLDPSSPGVATRLETLADAIVAGGIRQIDEVDGDDSRYDAQRFLPSWPSSYRSDFDITPMGALNVNHSSAIIGGKVVETDDPATFAASELTRLLRARGVTVTANPGHSSAPALAAPIASVRSQPLSTIVAWMFKTSDNLTAELLTKELGVRVSQPGTTAAGVDVIRSTLRSLGVSLDSQTMIDGSGLDRGNRLTCRILAAVVRLGTRPALQVLQAGLPVAPASFDGRVHAKGGYLTDVTGLAGTVSGADTLTFSFLANGGVPVKARFDLVQFAAVLGAYQPPALLSETVVSLP